MLGEGLVLESIISSSLAMTCIGGSFFVPKMFETFATSVFSDVEPFN
jgi:hypothetical protein